MVEDRAPTFAAHVRDTGVGGPGAEGDAADREVARAVDRLVWYAGWADKYQQVLGNLNPVSGPFFNILDTGAHRGGGDHPPPRSPHSWDWCPG